jgi:dipeptide/tripeptide permease
VIYLSRYLGWDDTQSATFFNVFMMVSYLSSIFGGGLADSAMGKYRTMLIFSVIYAIGQIFLATTAVPHSTGDPPSPWGAILGLVLIGLGTGGIKPCANAFGAEQLPVDKPALVQVCARLCVCVCLCVCIYIYIYIYIYMCVCVQGDGIHSLTFPPTYSELGGRLATHP